MYSNFDILSQLPHKDKRPARSIGAVEILAADEATVEEKLLAHMLSALLNSSNNLIITVHSKDLSNSISTERSSIEKSLRPEMNVIRYEFDSKNIDQIFWIPGNKNLSDTGTNHSCP